MIRKWYNSKNVIAHILIWATVGCVLLFGYLKSGRFIISQVNNDTPVASIRTEVLKNWGDSGHIYECLYKSFVLDASEVTPEEAQTWYDNGYDKNTQKIYRVTKNCPNMFAGYWIVTEIYHSGDSYFTARYGGI